MINKTHKVSVVRQCKILELSRSSIYYHPVPLKKEALDIMSLIDEIHLRYPFYGSRWIRDELGDNGFYLSRGQVSRS